MTILPLPMQTSYLEAPLAFDPFRQSRFAFHPSLNSEALRRALLAKLPALGLARQIVVLFKEQQNGTDAPGRICGFGFGMRSRNGEGGPPPSP